MTTLIAVPYHLGDRDAAVGAGPLKVLNTDAGRQMRDSTVVIDLGPKASWESVNHALAGAVTRVRAAGNWPVILAGNCNSCLGTLAGLSIRNPGILWFDAHGDFHTEQTSISGSIEGMSLTLATERFVPEDRVILAGARDLDPGESERVQEKLCYVPSADFAAAVLPDMREIYLHIDIDVLDTSISPGVNCRAPGGWTAPALLDAVAFAMKRYDVAAVAITNYNPFQDQENRTRDIIASILEFIIRLRRTAASR
jgi:arginase